MKLSKLYKEVAKEFDLKEDDVRKMSYHFFNSIANHFRIFDGRDITIRKFGSFSINKKRFNHMLYNYLQKYRKGLVKKETFYELFKKFWAAKQVMLKTEDERKKKS